MTASPDRMFLTEFLDWEQAQPDRWEFAEGYASPMAGTTDSHGQIVLNLGTLIRPKLRGTDCRVFANTVKVVASGRSSYPDIVVTCDSRDRNVRGHWELVADQFDGAVHLETRNVTVTLDELYEDVEFEAGIGRAQDEASDGR